MTNIILSLQTFFLSKHTFVMTKEVFCRNKHVYRNKTSITTKIIPVAAPANDII